jgi:hypothetical protein
MQPKIMELLDKAIVDEIFKDEEDFLIDDSLLEDFNDVRDTDSISTYEPDVYFFFDDEQSPSLAGELTDLSKASDCLSQENKKFEALSGKSHADEHVEQNSITKESKTIKSAACVD